MERCYRHPDRETGVACSNCERPICPDCMTTTSVGMRCPECAADSTRVVRGAGHASDPSLTYALIAVNVLVFAAATLSGGSATSGSIGASDLLSEGAVSRTAVADGEIWRVVTAGFLHAGLFHLMFNMVALWILGGLLEPAVGRLRFALIYGVSVLAGSFGALLLEPDALTVGASGGIFGLMGAAVVVMRSRGMDPMESGLGLWIGLNLLITFTVPGISIGGHLGGLAGGVLTAIVLVQLGARSRALPSAAAPVIAGMIGAAAVAGAIAVSASA